MVGVLEADLADGHADVYRPLAFPFADKQLNLPSAEKWNELLFFPPWIGQAPEFPDRLAFV
jgi:hypothetical protein